jgi:hypothetical protein
MVDALRRRRLPVAYVAFAGEPAEELPPLEIEFLESHTQSQAR